MIGNEKNYKKSGDIIFRGLLYSFSYCGITCDSDQDYYSELKME
jgi:hypothetical protein